MLSEEDFDINYVRLHIVRYISSMIANCLAPAILEEIKSTVKYFSDRMAKELENVRIENIDQDLINATNTINCPSWIRALLKLYNDNRVKCNTKLFEIEDIKSIKNLQDLFQKLKNGEHNKCLKILSLYLPKTFFCGNEEKSISEIDAQAAYCFKKCCKRVSVDKKKMKNKILITHMQTHYLQYGPKKATAR